MIIRLFAWIAFPVILGSQPAIAHGDLDQRIAQITGELRESPSAGLFFKRGCLHLEHGEGETALVPQAEPDLLLEVSTALAENKEATAALEVLDQGIARLGLLPSLVSAAIEIDFGNGTVEGALRRIDRARDAAARPEPWMARRASILARAGRAAESRAAWQTLLVHISVLPPGERASHAMYSRVREARAAVAALESIPR